MEFLKVSSKSSPASVAGAIAGMVKDGVPDNIQCVGAGAVNQAIKAVAIARGFLIPTGVDISCAPTFSDIEIGGESRTAIRIAIYVHPLEQSSATPVSTTL
jgi:stage V sporulation protein S